MPSSHNGHISITGVSKYFGRHKALDDVSLEIPRHGDGDPRPFRLGKSTLLRTINHLERVDEGFIQIDGDYIGYRRKGDKLYEMKERRFFASGSTSATCSRTSLPVPHLTVLENLIEAPIAHQEHAKRPLPAPSCWTWSDCAIKPTPGRGISPAASSSASPLPARWR
jgi:polar amino acid transport system ATP-binding protein